MKYNCELIQDLIPLYADDVLSETGKKIVEEHLSSCHECSEMLEIMKLDQDKKRQDKREYEAQVENYASRVKKRRKRLIALLMTGFCICVISVFAISYFIARDPFDYLAVKLDSYSEVVEYIEQGKAPSIMPQNSSEISIMYKLKNKRMNGKFHVNGEDLEMIKHRLKPASVKDLIESKEVVDGVYNQVKETLEKAPEGVEYYQDQGFVYVIVPDGTVYYYGK